MPIRYDPTNRAHIILRRAYGDRPFTWSFVLCRFA